MARRTRDKIAAAAGEGGWQLLSGTAGSMTYVRGSWRVFVEFTARGSINYASRSPRAGGLVGKRFTGAGKAEQVIAALEKPQSA